eukprot:3541354-Prymnesium_polylepis.3
MGATLIACINMTVVIFTAFIVGSSLLMELPFGSDVIDMPGLSYTAAAAEISLQMISPAGSLSEPEMDEVRPRVPNSPPCSTVAECASHVACGSIASFAWQLREIDFDELLSRDLAPAAFGYRGKEDGEDEEDEEVAGGDGDE